MTPYEAAQAFVALWLSNEKQASAPTLSYGLKGKLYLSNSGWVMLQVPNAIVRGAFDALGEPGVELPTNSSGVLNAHISVIRPEELEAAGIDPEKLSERGHTFSYTLGAIKEVKPAGWADVAKVWFIEVHSPELKALRKSYGLTPLPNDNKYEFHITFAVRKTGVLQSNGRRKAASVIHARTQPLFVTAVDGAAEKQSLDLNAVKAPFQQAGQFVSNQWNKMSPETQGNLVTLLGSMGVGAGVNAVTGALGAEPGYRAEAAKRDAFSGALGGLATYASIKGTQRLFNDGGSPVSAALAGLGGSALSKALYGMQYPLERAVFGRPSWDVMPEDLAKLQQQTLKQPQQQKDEDDAPGMADHLHKHGASRRDNAGVASGSDTASTAAGESETDTRADVVRPFADDRGAGAPAAPLRPALADQHPVRHTSFSDLQLAKRLSDQGHYDAKHELLRRLIQAEPGGFSVDSQQRDLYGVTHSPTGFRYHMPMRAAPAELRKTALWSRLSRSA